MTLNKPTCLNLIDSEHCKKKYRFHPSDTNTLQAALSDYDPNLNEMQCHPSL